MNDRVEPFNATSFNEWADLGTAPALPESQKLYNKLLSLGIKIVFLTGRANKQKNITAKNLRLAGYHTREKLICKDTSIYHGKTAVTYKSSERKKLEEEGYKIIGNIGDHLEPTQAIGLLSSLIQCTTLHPSGH
ncbi:putative Acid phosphatase [Medicago truncatula]|uniref:Putative Acid phosphatase n=1 Tax=Medicago truncatula TaxID=3880 RepID=A0A396H7V4_MEDTR|nr:putative Acid phosphatase [Medicago truncatula]